MATGKLFETGVGWRDFAASDIPASGVSAGTYGDSTHVGQFTVAANGTITAASAVAITGGGGGGGTGIIATVQYAPASLATYTPAGASLAALDTTNLTVSFTVPASAAVVVRFAAVMASDGSLGVGLLNHSGGAQLGYTINNAASNTSAASEVNLAWYLTGLSSGATLGIDIAAGHAGLGASHIYAEGKTGPSSTADAGPALIVVESA